MIKVNGLKSCDTCRKATKWLEAEGKAYTFRDVREDAVTLAEIKKWGAAAGWEKLVNKASTTWRGLEDADKEKASGPEAATLLLAHPTLIKRPVFEAGDRVLVGFRAAQQEELKAL